nr:hypothetical protein DM860_011472 [Ipomoea trifida]
MSDEFTTPTGPSTDTTPNLTQQTTTEELTTPAEQQEKVDEMLPPEPQEKESQQTEQDDEEENPIQMQTEKSLGKQQTTTEELTALAEQQDDVDEEKSLNGQKQGRKKRHVKPTNPLKSPYLTRQVDMKRPWTATEKIIGKWVLQNDNVDPTRIIFKHGPYAVIWDDMLSLNKNREIKVGIIDAWSAILNQKEKTRSSSSPCRYFASTFVCSSPYLPNASNLRGRRLEILKSRATLLGGTGEHGGSLTNLDAAIGA